MATFYRLLGFLRPYKRGVTVSGALASLAMVMTVLMPLLMGQAVETINNASADLRHPHSATAAHDRHTLALLAAGIVAVVLARWALTYWRRMVAGQVSLGIE